MKFKLLVIFLIFGGMIFQSCKNSDSEKTVVEIDEERGNDRIYFEGDIIEVGNEKFLDSIENYIIRDYLSERDLRSMTNAQRKFQIKRIDLNNDGKEEIFVNFTTTYFCGTGGCTVLLLSKNLSPITEFTVTKPPLYIEETMMNGWKVLMVQSDGKWRKLTFDDGTYPSNPSVAEISLEGPSESSEILFDVKNDSLRTYSF